MTETVLYCYECRQSTLQGTSQSIAEPLCPQCQSAFVEITEQPAPVRIPMGVFDPNLRLFQGSAGTALYGCLLTDADMRLHEISTVS